MISIPWPIRYGVGLELPVLGGFPLGHTLNLIIQSITARSQANRTALSATRTAQEARRRRRMSEPHYRRTHPCLLRRPGPNLLHIPPLQAQR